MNTRNEKDRFASGIGIPSHSENNRRKTMNREMEQKIKAISQEAYAFTVAAIAVPSDIFLGGVIR